MNLPQREDKFIAHCTKGARTALCDCLELVDRDKRVDA